jgi:CRISPR type I-E-associated protein CasB/Cse2
MTEIEYQNPFLEFLHSHRDDRGLMASLRRGLAQPNSAEVHRVIQCFLSSNDKPWLESAYYTIGPLFALHHDNVADKGNMGTHFRAMCEPGEDPPRNIERRFMQLLASDANELDDLLRQAVSLLKSKDVAVNWQQLLADVLAWKHTEDQRDIVRKQWSRTFWRKPSKNHHDTTELPTPKGE